MTLKEFEAKYNRQSKLFTGPNYDSHRWPKFDDYRAYILEQYPNPQARTISSSSATQDESWDLHHLDDFVVTGSTGVGFWLMPKSI